MRKYFLLGATVLLAVNTANATTDYAEVTAKATIEVARQFECTDFDFGTIVIKENNPETTVVIGDGFEEYDESIILEYDETMGTAGEIIMQLYPKPGAYVSNVISIDGKLIIANPSAGDFSTVVNMYVINE